MVDLTTHPLPASSPKPPALIAIINYEMGNLRSVQKAFEKVGHSAIITDQVKELQNADRIVLPGVGAFSDAINEIRNRDLEEPIRELIQSGKPFLGICLGLQMLFEMGYESLAASDGKTGMGLVAGTVEKFQLPSPFKIPHMGWNQVTIESESPVLNGIASGAYFYFVHSYYVKPSQQSDISLTTDYGGDFCAAIARDNIFATQFHPEKSQETGLQLIKNFAEWEI